MQPTDVATKRWWNRVGSLGRAMPVVAREMRAESRRSNTYWLRVLAGTVSIAFFATFSLSAELPGRMLGPMLFAVLQRGLSLGMWIIVPLMTADCISSEKREGTLGLLFLTPLTVLDVIMAKAASNILRAVTLLLASLPLLVLPFVLGGVTSSQILFAFLYVTNALLLGIAAGLYASAKGGSAIQVMVMSEGYALALAILSTVLNLFTFGWFSWVLTIRAAPVLAFGFRFAAGMAISISLFVMVVQASVSQLRETWDRDSANPEQPRWVKLFSTSEFWQAAFHWERGRTLDRNPIAWLQEYSWTARLTKWGWLTAMLMMELIALVGYLGWQPQLTAALSLGVAFSAAGSFRRERQTGLLEILLVTPVSARSLIGGRLWGICGHFLPSLAVLMICWNADRLLNTRAFERNSLAWVGPNPLAFLALTVFGLYLSLGRLNFLLAWALTWTLAFGIPAFASIELGQSQVLPTSSIIALTSMFQLTLAVISWILLMRSMEQRRFLEVDRA
jgi:hypothetical protein